MSPDRLVYSTDPRENQRCPRCGELQAACTCAPAAAVDPAGVEALIRLEKKNRGGKSVTVIDRLPADRDFLKNLERKLKASCGCGGTSGVAEGQGYVEIQGDKRDQVRQQLARLGLRSRG